MSYKILSDSTCSLNNEVYEECGADILGLSFIMKGEEFLGTEESNLKMFYDNLRKKENASTSCINVQRFLIEFEQRLREGIDILYIAFSSALSATYANACAAREELKDKYPERKIIIIDSFAASSGQGFLLYHACEQMKQGKTIEEVEQWVLENRLKVSHLFTVEDLFFLYRGGRVKPTSYLIASMLNVKPLMHVPNDGSLQAYGKVIGRKKSINALVNKMAETIVNPEEQVIFICNGDCPQDVEYAVKLINEKIKVKGVKVFYTDPVVGVHSGPGTLAFFYFSKERA